jgi:hypothetical protein
MKGASAPELIVTSFTRFRDAMLAMIVHLRRARRVDS